MSWGKRIREARTAKEGMTQEKLAGLIGVAQQTVDGYESTTKPQEPNIATFQRIGKELEVNPAWLAFGHAFAKRSINEGSDNRLDRSLMEATIVVFEQFMTKMGHVGDPISPQKRATMLMFAYNLAEILGVDKLEPELQRLYSLARKS